MRVLLVTHYYPEHRSGIEIIAHEIARRLAARGVEIVWAASDLGAAADSGDIRRLPMRTWNVSEQFLGVPYPLWSASSLARLKREVAHCDLVHIHDSLYLGNVFAFLCARWQRKPVVVTQHIGLVPYSQRLLRGLMGLANHTLARMVLRHSDQCVLYARQVEAYFAPFVQFRRPPRFIANGVDAEQFQPPSAAQREKLRRELGWPEDRPILLFVGRFVEKKGLPFLRELARKWPDASWVCVGWGPLDPRAWGLANVICAGSLPQREIAAYYQAADVLVLPSVGEGFPLVVQEALSCGTPAMIAPETARAVPGIKEVVWVAELEAEQWLTKLRSATSDREQLAARRQAAAAYARQHWDWDACANQYLQLFHELTDSHDARAH